MSKLQAPQGLEGSARRFTAGISPSRRRAMSQSFSTSFFVRLEKMNVENKRREFRSCHPRNCFPHFLHLSGGSHSDLSNSKGTLDTPTLQHSNTAILQYS
jgi:hypothetical protein